eukprot:TRINITY_DN1902_c0_g1_i2.p2 TRINITY_DN1902_c0_g1~~TRINITY_DN1902_c0_g1_i2.p2  ORF type:complete len:105 (-),score=27.88 TRINITY_DN1902_c0_g1_i2:37-351(-)
MDGYARTIYCFCRQTDDQLRGGSAIVKTITNPAGQNKDLVFTYKLPSSGVVSGEKWTVQINNSAFYSCIDLNIVTGSKIIVNFDSSSSSLMITLFSFLLALLLL